MVLYKSLVCDHDRVKDLLRRLVKLEDGAKESSRHELILQINRELTPHARAEEAVLYNSIRAVNTVQDLVWHSYSEHLEVESLLRGLQAVHHTEMDWRMAARKLQDVFESHILEEENKIIPIAEELFTRSEAEAMGRAFEELKPEIRDDGIVQATLDFVAGFMPKRLAAPLRNASLQSRRH